MNNRQNGRRRGRNNNQRPQGGQSRGGGDSGNRIDSRARGNAAQLLEKYKNLAREAQLAGDRVQTEYYLQFADHYFRVLADSRSRQEEQRASRQDDRYDSRDDLDEGAPFGFGDEGETGDPGDDVGDPGRERSGRDRDGHEQGRNGRGRNDRGERGERRPRADAGERGSSEGRDHGDEGENRTFASDDLHNERSARRGNGRTRRRPFGEPDDDSASAAIDAAVLPPAIGASTEAAAGEAVTDEPAPRPRLRARKPKADDSAVAEELS